MARQYIRVKQTIIKQPRMPKLAVKRVNNGKRKA